MKNTEKKISAILDEFIARDEPNNLFDVYEEQTGKEPVPAEGGHTEEFTLWFVTKVRNAVKAGCNTVESVIAFIRNGDKTMEGYKTFKELNAEERLELKQRMVVEMNDEKGEGTSYGELAWANDTITDEMLEKRYGNVMFTEEDFAANF